MLGTNIHLAKTASLVLSQAHDFTRSVSEFIKHVLKPLKTLYIFLIYTHQKALQTYDSRWIFLLRTNHTNAWRETRAVVNSVVHRRTATPWHAAAHKKPGTCNERIPGRCVYVLRGAAKFPSS